MSENKNNRLRKIRLALELTQEEFAKKLGIPRATLGNYETGRASIPADIYSKLDELERHDISYLKDGVFFPSTKSGQSDIVLVDYYPAEVSAGYGSTIDMQDDIQKLPVLRSVIYPFTPNQVKAIAVRGDSMIGANISDGDIALFAPTIKEGNGIFIITVGDKAFVKRIEFDPFGQWIRLISDNPRYEPQKIAAEYFDTFKIEGKVIAWIHRNRE